LLASLGSSSAVNVLGFVSALPNEGVSTICVGVARVLAATEKVLLIDASPGGQAVSAWLSVERRPLAKGALPARLELGV
jgi:Mrp family chromosome partitioning ATPase